MSWYVHSKPWAIVLDDHKLYTEFFAFFLERAQIFDRIFGFTEEEQVIDFLKLQKAGHEIVIFLDYYFKDNQTALPLLSDLRRIYRHIHIVIVSSVINPVLINKILTYKIEGFLSKVSGPDEIAACLHQIRHGKQYISPAIEQMLSNNIIGAVPFTAREVEIMSYFARGLSVEATAKEMKLSRHTIVSHRRRMMAKTDTHTIGELLAYARKIELV